MLWSDREKRLEYYNDYYQRNRQKYLDRRKVYYAKNKTRIAEEMRAYVLKQNYGLTVAQFDEMFASQKFSCGICGRKQRQTEHRLHVDHCHKTGKVRGILCGSCNMKLGWYELRQEAVNNYLKGK